MSIGHRARTWSKRTEEHVGWYVYALRDPRNGAIFYIGKGRGNRAFQHAHHASDVQSPSSAKLDVIREIQETTGCDPDIIVVRHQLPNESAAYEVEAALLDYSTFLTESGSRADATPSLTNIAGGWHSHSVGLMSQEAIEASYSAEPLRKEDFSLPALAFRIPRLWTPAMTIDELYEATHGWWRLGERRAKAEYALAVSRGVIRALFTIDSSTWRLRRDGDREWQAGEKPRWGFSGSDVRAEWPQYMNRDISSWFTEGSRSPFIYINC